MPRIEIPDWRFEPEPVWVSSQAIKEADWLIPLKEVIVRFKADGEQLVAFVPEWYIERSRSGMWGAIITDVEGGVLVDIPVETLTCGRRIMVRDSERESVLSPRHQGNC